MKNPSDYTVGIVCALSIERAAVEAMFDESHPLPDLSSDDTNSYTLGRIGKHNVVVTALPAGRYGTNAAATVVTQMKQCFTSIKFCLLVGIGGGAPSERNDVRLGDIVVSMPVETFGGVIQYDLGEKIQGQEELHLRGSLNSPPEVVLTALTALRAAHERQNSRIDDYIAHMFVSNDAMKSEYAYPGDSCDRLCPPELQHPSADAECGPQCIDSAIIRPPRQGLNRFIHYGLIASGNVVVKDAISRDRWARQHNILCFEMEAAGLMNTFPCLVIRGISDYADSHKNDRWQRYAAARAAAYAKEFLGFVMPAVVRPPQVVESSEALQSLSYPEMDNRQKDIEPALIDTCSWLVEHPTYEKWFNACQGVLLIRGKPGSGKSTLMEYAARQAIKYQDSSIKSTIVSHFFHGRGIDIQKTPFGLLKNVLHQLLQVIPPLHFVFSEIFENKKKTLGPYGSSWQWHLKDLQEFFFSDDAVHILKEYPVKVYVDALDECEKDTKMLLSFFNGLLARLPKISICISSRHYPDILIPKSHEIGTIEKICVEEENHSDIRLYVREKFEDLKRFREEAQREKDAEILMNQILNKAKGVFQWVNLVVRDVVDSYNKGNPLRSIQTRLKQVPGDLGGLYSRILDQIKIDNKPERILKLIQWIYCAARPLSLAELRVAMAFDPNRSFTTISELEDSDDYADSDEQMQELVKSLSGGLAEVSHGSDRSFVQFIHQSVNDFIAEGGLRCLMSECFGSQEGLFPMTISEGRSHDQLSRFCASYIATKDVMSYDGYFKIWADFPFLVYACDSLFLHAKEAENQECLDPKLFLNSLQWPSHKVFQRWWKLVGNYGSRNWSFKRGATSLFHTAVAFNLFNIVEALLDEGVGINFKQGEGYTALYLAVCMKNEEMVRRLLEYKANTEVKSEKLQRTPLQKAAEIGHEAIVSLLHAHGADTTSTDKDGRTAFHYAVENGHEKIMELLLAWKNNCMDTDNNGNTAIHIAMSNMEERTLQLLVRRNVDITATNNKGETALHVAIKKAQPYSSWRRNAELLVRIIEILLQARMDVNAADSRGRTALHLAVEAEGRAMRETYREWQMEEPAIVTLLLKHGANVTLKDKEGVTALQKAAAHRSLRILKVIEEITGIVDPNPNATVQLHDAVVQEDELLVEQLLNAGADVNAVDKRGETPLSCAAAWSSDSMVRLLLERGADQSAGREKPIFLAALHHRITTVDLLLDYLTDIEAKHIAERVALHAAAGFGEVELVAHLLDKGVVDERDEAGKTALSEAVEGGRSDVVELLLRRSANARDVAGWDEALLCSIKRVYRGSRHIDVTRILLDAGADPNVVAVGGRTALQQATINGYFDLVPLLVSHGADLEARDPEQNTALHYALFGQWTEKERSSKDRIAIWLVEQGADPTATNRDGKGPLHIAAETGNEDMVQFLLSKHAGDKLDDPGWEHLSRLARDHGYTYIHSIIKLARPAKIIMPAPPEIIITIPPKGRQSRISRWWKQNITRNKPQSIPRNA